MRDLLESIRRSREVLEPPMAAIVLKALHGVAGVGDIAQRYGAIVGDCCEGDWIEKASLYDAMIVVAVLYERGEAQGGQLARVVKRLLSAEVHAGGPYRDDYGTVDVETNLAVLYFARVVGIALPNTEEYVRHAVDISALGFVQRYLFDGTVSEYREEGGVVAAALVLRKYAFEQKMQALPEVIALHSNILQSIKMQLATLQSPLRAPAQEVYEKVCRADKNQEIALISTFFGDCLGDVFDTSLYSRLGVANFYIWMAYTIYDDFLDGEGQARYLPVANMAARQAWQQYSMLTSSRMSTQWMADIFIRMDESNAWEVEHCRLQVRDDRVSIGRVPAYGQRRQLAMRSLAHALGPLLLVAQRYGVKAREMRYVKRGFEQYLIARQLNDDAHDWLEDMRAGQVSFVVAHILRELRVQPGEYNMSELTDRMKRHFWRHSAVQICDITLRHIQLSREAFDASGIIDLGGHFSELLTKIEKSAQRTRARQISERRFMEAYRASNS